MDVRPKCPFDPEYCPGELVAHIAEIEAGWTLGKPWKAQDEQRVEQENRDEIRTMLERWREHGIEVRQADRP